MTARYKVFDNIEKKWFQPIYEKRKDKLITIREFLFTQEGDAILYERLEGPDVLFPEKMTPEHLLNKRYSFCMYSETRDREGTKAYHNDVLLFSNGSVGVLLVKPGSLWIGSGPTHNYHAEDQTDSRQIQQAKIIGSVLETPDYHTLLHNRL